MLTVCTKTKFELSELYRDHSNYDMGAMYCNALQCNIQRKIPVIHEKLLLT